MRKLLLLAMTLVICGGTWAQNEFVYVKQSNRNCLYGKLTHLSITNGNGDTLVLSGKDITLIVKDHLDLQSWNQNKAKAAKRLFKKQHKNLQQQLKTGELRGLKNASSLMNPPSQSFVYIEQSDGNYLYAVLNELILMDENHLLKKQTANDIIKIVKNKKDVFVSERYMFQDAFRTFGEPEEQAQLQLAYHEGGPTPVHTPIVGDSMLRSNNLPSTGETIILRAQTSIPMKATYKVHAKDVLVGDRIPFKVSADIYQDGKLVIPAGTKAYARVTKARKSIPIGIQGRLEFVMDYLKLHNGQRIYLEGRDIKIKGKNRTRMAFGVALVTLGFGYFIPGTKAVLPQGYEVVAHALSNQEIVM